LAVPNTYDHEDFGIQESCLDYGSANVLFFNPDLEMLGLEMSLWEPCEVIEEIFALTWKGFDMSTVED
jgi:hypothetical protein